MQLAWYVNSATGNDANDGATALTALKTGRALYNKTGGSNAVWDRGIYNVYLCAQDIVHPDLLTLGGIRLKGGQIWIHGGATAGVGKTVLYTSIAGIQAKTTVVPATNTRGQITDNAVPGGTWMAAGLISTNTAPNKRIRLTSGTNIGAVAWPQKDLGGGAVAVSQWIIPPTSASANLLVPLSPPSIGDTFIVESLTHIDEVLIEIEEVEDGFVDSVLGNTYGIFVESIDMFRSTSVTNNFKCNSNISAIASSMGGGANTTYQKMLWIASQLSGSGITLGGTSVIWSCHCTSAINGNGGLSIVIDGDTICQSSSIAAIRSQAIRIGGVACFDASAEGLRSTDGGTLILGVIVGPTLFGVLETELLVQM
jgi:hypothetical protein